MPLYVTSDSCLLCDVTIASPVFDHRGQHHLISLPKGTITSLYSVLLSIYFWPWMFIVSHSSFEQGNAACIGGKKSSVLWLSVRTACCVQLRLPYALVDWTDLTKFSIKHLWSVWSCIANSTPRGVLGSPSFSDLFYIQIDLKFGMKLHIT